MKAVIYARVSPTKKDDTLEGMAKSIENQITKCKTAIVKDGNNFIKSYVDQYISGKEQEFMKDFLRLKYEAMNDEFDVVYCLRDDRLGRSQREGIEIIDDFAKARVHIEEEVTNSVGKKIKAKVIYKLQKPIHFIFVEEGIGTSTADGVMMAGMLSSVAERNRKRIIENTTRGRLEAIAKGVKFGPKLLPIDWEYVKELRTKNHSFQEIAKRLRNLGGKMKTISTTTLIRRYRAEIGEPGYVMKRIVSSPKTRGQK